MVQYVKGDFSVKDLIVNFQCDVLGDEKRSFNNLSLLDNIQPSSLIYIQEKKYIEVALRSFASVVVFPLDFKGIVETFDGIESILKDKTLIFFYNPKFLFSKVSSLFKSRKPEYGVHPTVSSGSVIDSTTCEIGPYTVIGRDVKLGKDVIIGSNVNIGDNVIIGDNTVIFPSVTIYENCEIGKNCIIHANTVIGSDGFGYVNDKGINYKIEHLGKVVIENDVEIGSNSSVDRGTIGTTLIKKGSKIDNLVQIAHNTTIGSNSIVCSQVGIAGGATVGDNVILAGQVGVSDHCKVGNNVIVGAQAGLTPKNYPDNSFLLGTPAMNALDFKKSSAIFFRLPQLDKQLSQLQTTVENLSNTINNIVKKMSTSG
ncbi:MAG TPA: UDP-3-O-(3-hydroxymyristoyl)glucosamine N-acyltransferase [Exilispira sp.]|nr:UDP-3-O-(3-hydroxymyristoyl)glucosamine N-acyltransferase [Exilispira sp.]